MEYSTRIKDLLKKRGIETEEEMEKFLNPSLSGFYDPFLLFNMERAVKRIQKAIINKEKIVIYGDYDADGISAVSMLYLYFKKQGIDVCGFIPSRHHDGYGITKKTVHFITNHYNPSLVITVDTGISAKDEIKSFNNLGVDTIVTDHHEPPKEIPDGIVVDPKIEGQKYPFNGLSGAGVALKLIQALSGVEESLNYIDICAISTIGDIVPLIDENRLITKLGLERINSKKARPSICYFKSKLGLETLTSTDIAFKVVPRLNACGRMTTAEKCFHFLCETKTPRLEKLYAEMEEDNNARLIESGLIMDRIYEHLSHINLNEEPCIFIMDKEINLGLIGIIASKLCVETYRPVFIFTEDEEGRLKASIRSIKEINIFNILDKYRDLLVDVGGHSLAGGLTILKENYNKFKEVITRELKQVDPSCFHNTEEMMYDQEIDTRDITLEFAKELEKLEPYGFQNPKPVFKLTTNNTTVLPLKSPKHYKIGVGKNKEVMCFFGTKYLPILENKGINKNLFINLEVDTYLSKPRAKAILKNLAPQNYGDANEEELAFSKELIYNSLPKSDANKLVHYTNEVQLNNILNASVHTLIIADNILIAKQLADKYKKVISYTPLLSGETVVLYNPQRTIDFNDIKLYKHIVVACGESITGAYKCFSKNVYILQTHNKFNFNTNREELKSGYAGLMSCLPIEGNNIMEVSQKISKKTQLKISEVVFAIIVSSELGFINLDKTDGVKLQKNKTITKKELTESPTYSYFAK